MATSYSSDQTTLQKDTGAISVLRAARTRITSIQGKGIAGSVLLLHDVSDASDAASGNLKATYKFETEGLDKKKFKLSIKNLKHANNAINFFYKKNIKENSTILKHKAILSEDFFNYPEEILFRSFSEILKLVGNKYFFVRGKKIERILKSLTKKTNVKYTLGNCIIEKINKTVIVLKEHNN